ncbi:MAG: amidase [Hyphomicrobiales bacterium]
MSAHEVGKAALEAIAKVDPILNFTVQVFPERVEALGRIPPQGIMAGVPTLLKDFYKFEKGTVSECGCMLTKGLVGWYDSELVLRLRRAGMPILGRSSVPELGWSSSCSTRINGITRNPWQLETWPGGSSSGAAVAVAAGAVPIAHASDGAGSTRSPAAYQGLVGLKPSRGRVSDAPGSSEAYASMSAHLAVTRTVRDTAVMLDVLSGPSPGDSHAITPPPRPFLEELGQPVRQLRIALDSRPLDGGAVDPVILAALQSTARMLESMGHAIEPVDLPVSGEAVIASLHVIWSSAMAASLDFMGARVGREPGPDSLTRTTFATYLDGKRTSATRYVNALNEMNAIRRKMGEFQEGFDVILSPTTTMLAQKQDVHDQEADFDGLSWTRYMLQPEIFLPLHNITGCPAISLPLHHTDGGAQIGMQLVGPFGDDALLLRLAAELERTLPWRSRRPPIHVANDLAGFCVA